MTYDPDIIERFKECLHRDGAAGTVETWMTVWHWKELAPQFGDSQSFLGAVELVNWLLGQSTCRRYFNELNVDRIDALAAMASATDRKILSAPIFSDFLDRIKRIDFANYGIYSAQDYFFQTIVPFASGEGIEHVLDFGAGSGRQFCLWSKHDGLKTFISVDGLPQTYGIQHTYYSQFDVKYREYVAEDPDFELDFGKELTLNHIPTWAIPKIPSASIDLVVAVQVLGELRPTLFHWLMGQFSRVMRPGGRLYIRDHGMVHCPNRINIPEALINSGFILEYEPYFRDMKQIHGIPKLWRKPYNTP
jgi:SAM-dependent methyltransferase